MKISKRLILMYLLLMAAALFSASTIAKQYYIYGDPKNGTRFKEQLYAWPVPLNKSYSRLSRDHQLIVRSDYPQMAEDDTPPYPSRGVGKVLKPFVEEFRWFGGFSGGNIYALVDETGQVVKVDGSPTIHAEVLGFMNRHLRTVRFDSGLCSGDPCSAVFVLKLHAIRNPKREDYL